MDRYSFLNTVHPKLIEELYHRYLHTPDQIEPSWRAFFQGFCLPTLFFKVFAYLHFFSRFLPTYTFFQGFCLPTIEMITRILKK
ncbi:2-oxoglutarate dehydrogenase E1 subunit family protein [Candidatus Walczuchella endosymbiont of Icerya purchasi]|uniref:2-oxoglutarate dehydrogenase E1 subunit family protein n=1 Tax=Candidatus Walczuchella endosymbiont of Icerya purchasi TaxID=3066219 RepID=UPI003CC79FE7